MSEGKSFKRSFKEMGGELEKGRMTQLLLLDGVARRQIALAGFASLVAFKLHQVASHFLGLGLGAGLGLDGVLGVLGSAHDGQLSSSHILAWSIADACYLFLLRVSNVPRLRFSVGLTLVLALSMALINAGIIGGIHVSVSILSSTLSNPNSVYRLSLLVRRRPQHLEMLTMRTSLNATSFYNQVCGRESPF